MRRPIAVLTLSFAALWPAGAWAGGLDLRLGAFFPKGDSADTNLFRDDSDLYTLGGALGPNGRPPGLSMHDWIGFAGGIEYNARLMRNVELAFSVDGYGRSLQTAYRDYVRSDGRDISQRLELTVVPIGVAVRLVPTSRRARLAPFASAGVDLFYWRYEERGDFVDFDDPAHPIIADNFISDGVTPGFHVAGGLRIPVSDDVSIVAEGRYQWAKDDMGDDFFRAVEKNRINLSGPSATLGVHIRF